MSVSISRLMGILICSVSPGAGAQPLLFSERGWIDHTEELVKELRKQKEVEVKKEYLSKDLRKSIEQNLERSYFTAFSGFRTNDDQTASNLLYEAQIFHNLNAYSWDDSWLDVPVRFVVRQLRQSSNPVLTPTFNPGARFSFRSDTPGLCGPYTACYGSVGVFHYSNGQDGDPTFTDGSVNARNGSFSTWYLEPAWQWVKDGKWLRWSRLSWRHHFRSTWDIAQDKQYETDHAALMLRSKYVDCGHFLGCWPFHHVVQTTITGIYSFAGREYVTFNQVDSTQNVKARIGDNLSASLEFALIPKSPKDWRSGLGIYFRYDYGYDYYNINFQHRINRLQIGIVSTNLGESR